MRSLIAAFTLAVLLGTTAAEARPDRYREGREGGYVTAESRFGHGVVSGPVRYTSRGRQVQLPGGTWLWCERSCAETLRTSTVDFWENQGADSRRDHQCGVFGCLDIRFGW